MHHVLGPYSDHALTLLRIVAGFLFLCHGAQKFGLIQAPVQTTVPTNQASVAQQRPPANQSFARDIEGADNIPVRSGWIAQLRLPEGRRLIAGVIELLGGIFMMAGLLTSSVAFVASGLMAVAYFLVHAPQGFFPLFNRGEPAALFCFVWLYLATRPPTRFALDHLLSKNRDGHQATTRLRRAS